jgi:hypothetical protein
LQIYRQESSKELAVNHEILFAEIYSANNCLKPTVIAMFRALNGFLILSNSLISALIEALNQVLNRTFFHTDFDSR